MGAKFDGKFISFHCECGQIMKVPVEHAGARGSCKACGRRLIVPTPAHSLGDEESAMPPDDIARMLQQRDLEGSYSEEDLITYPDRLPPRKPQPRPAEPLEADKTLFEMLGDILRYPVANKQAMQIFLSGAILFSPIVWKAMLIGKFAMFCCVLYVVQLFILVSIISIRLMYFSYLLLIIENSAMGSKHIPDLPVFQSWQDNLLDLLKVLAASAIAFAPFLVYSASINIELFSELMEASARGEPPGEEIMGGASYNLAMLMLIYAVAAFYMPMVFMVLVVTKNFAKAVNPVFIFRSIVRIWREYLAAMVIIFLFLRTSLTIFTILKDILAVDWLSAAAAYVGEPVVKFYVIVVTMHVIGLLYYRNSKKLQW